MYFEYDSGDEQYSHALLYGLKGETMHPIALITLREGVTLNYAYDNYHTPLYCAEWLERLTYNNNFDKTNINVYTSLYDLCNDLENKGYTATIKELNDVWYSRLYIKEGETC